MASTTFGQGAAAAGGTAIPKKAYKKWSVGINGGVNMFYGDIKQYDWAPVMHKNGSSRSELGFGVQGNVSRTLGNIWGVRGSLMYGTLAGMKRATTPSVANHGGSYINTKLIEYDLTLTANISNMFFSDKTKARKITVYGLAGVGLMHFRTLKKGLKDDVWIASQGYKTQGTEKKAMTSEVVIPVGLGIKFRLSKSLDLTIENTLYNVNSDKLDATAKALTSRDKYMYTSLGLAMKFGKKGAEEAAEWTNPYADIATNMDEVQTNIDGLTKDTDGDGVGDHFDKEPNTAAGVTVDGAGRAMDTDGDGVPDHLDADPFTAKGAKVGSDGKELDSDGDGVGDSKDLEPNTPAGALVNFQGKKIEVQPGKAAAESSTTYVSGGLPSIYFKVNSSQIDYWSSYDKLAEVAQALKAAPSAKLRIIGNADQTGSEGYNKTLAEKRSKAAADNLKKVYGVDAGRITTETRGNSEPLTGVKDAYNVNRRVDFVIVK